MGKQNISSINLSEYINNFIFNMYGQIDSFPVQVVHIDASKSMATFCVERKYVNCNT